MNSTHVAVGVGSISAMDAVTTILTGFHGLDAAHASSWAWLICAGGGALASTVLSFIKWKWPPAAVG